MENDTARSASAEGLSGIETILQRMGFDKRQDGLRVSYVLQLDGHTLWADQRKSARLEFYVDPEPHTYEDSHTRGNFVIPDADLGRKRDHGLQQLISFRLSFYLMEKRQEQRRWSKRLKQAM